MTVLVVGDCPGAIWDFLSRRSALGQDGHDEVWEGVYHVAPHARTGHGFVQRSVLRALQDRADLLGLHDIGEFNLGKGEGNYRVPDAGWLRDGADELYVPTAVAVLEVLSPGDETYEKFDFYRAQGVGEILVAHPGERWVKCYVNDAGVQYLAVDRSQVFDISMDELTRLVRWP